MLIMVEKMPPRWQWQVREQWSGLACVCGRTEHIGIQPKRASATNVAKHDGGDPYAGAATRKTRCHHLDTL